MAKTTKTTKLLNALLGGKKLTHRQIARKFKIANPTAHVNYCRTLGFDVINKDKKYLIA